MYICLTKRSTPWIGNHLSEITGRDFLNLFAFAVDKEPDDSSRSARTVRAFGVSVLSTFMMLTIGIR